MNILLILAENSWKTEIKLFSSALFHIKTSLKYFVNNFRFQSVLKMFLDGSHFFSERTGHLDNDMTFGQQHDNDMTFGRFAILSENSFVAFFPVYVSCL